MADENGVPISIQRKAVRQEPIFEAFHCSLYHVRLSTCPCCPFCMKAFFVHITQRGYIFFTVLTSICRLLSVIMLGHRQAVPTAHGLTKHA